MTAVHDLAQAGVSVWLDDLNRSMVREGALASYVDRGIVGVTTNPTIFAAALKDGEAYSSQVSQLRAQEVTVDATDVAYALMVSDVQEACDVLTPTFESSGGLDGRVSLEVDPRLAGDADGTAAMAKDLWARVDRPNLMVKIPATVEGLGAITDALSAGISVNVTLIFSLDRYRAVMSAWMAGLEAAHESGRDVSTIHSVASFFISRVDAEVDKRLEALGTDKALALRGQAAIANARLAYAAHREVLDSDRWRHLASLGAPVQRPLWASTSVKSPDYPDTMYVSELVAPGTVNTMPMSTIEAFEDHGVVPHGSVVSEGAPGAQDVMDALARLGIDMAEVTDLLEREGVSKFEASWSELMDTVTQAVSGETKGSS